MLEIEEKIKELFDGDNIELGVQLLKSQNIDLKEFIDKYIVIEMEPWEKGYTISHSFLEIDMYCCNCDYNYNKNFSEYAMACDISVNNTSVSKSLLKTHQEVITKYKELIVKYINDELEL